VTLRTEAVGPSEYRSQSGILEKALRLGYNPFHPGDIQSKDFRGFVRAHEVFLKECQNMKKLLALMFALALSVSMSSFAFAQAGGDKPMDKMDKKEGKKEKKHHKDHHKKDKKDDMKKDEAK
jgi:hypothetical protein